MQITTVRYAEAQDSRLARACAAGGIRRCQLAAPAAVARRPAGGQLCFALGGERCFCAKARIAVRLQARQLRFVFSGALRLPPRGAAVIGGKIQPEPVQVVYQRGNVRFARTDVVGIFYSELHDAAGPLCHQPVKQGGADIAKMQVAGGAGGKAGGDCRHRLFFISNTKKFYNSWRLMATIKKLGGCSLSGFSLVFVSCLTMLIYGKFIPMQKINKQLGEEKTARNPIKIVPINDLPKKPPWIRVKAPHNQRFTEIKRILRAHGLHSVCEEASCPNIGECFGKGTATFMILGDLCTRRCPFCDVGHGRPLPPDRGEPENLARVIAELRLSYVVITSVDRDDLLDGGAAHFAACIRAVREKSPRIKIEVLTPDFRGRMERALEIFADALPDVFNHNLETVPRLYKKARPGADYAHSLHLLQMFKQRYDGIPTKSGVMVGLGETDAEIDDVMQDMRMHGIDMLTIGQYLQPTRGHLPVERFVPPSMFDSYRMRAGKLGFAHAACGPLVRSSYHADLQAGALLT